MTFEVKGNIVDIENKKIYYGLIKIIEDKIKSIDKIDD